MRTATDEHKFVVFILIDEGKVTEVRESIQARYHDVEMSRTSYVGRVAEVTCHTSRAAFVHWLIGQYEAHNIISFRLL